jgi:hypothetical protein
MGIRTHAVWLDYSGAKGRRKLLQNLSAVVWADPYLWTASDEGRTVECLAPHRGGFRLHRQIPLDDIFTALPGRAKQDEVDIESLAMADGRLWICGSHCIVRRQTKKTGSDHVDPDFRVRKSRRLLGSMRAGEVLDGGAAAASSLPFSGKGSLRRLLAQDRYLAPFIDLPGKENGLDIEGLVVHDGRLWLGLRGPLVDSIAIVVELPFEVDGQLDLGRAERHFLQLDGLGVRDLTRRGDKILVLAGPVSATPGPFRLYAWTPRHAETIQQPRLVHQWPDGSDAPEGICCKDDGLLVVYDVGSSQARIRGNRFRADLLTGL